MHVVLMLLGIAHSLIGLWNTYLRIETTPGHHTLQVCFLLSALLVVLTKPKHQPPQTPEP